jgi:hypothetical protein
MPDPMSSIDPAEKAMSELKDALSFGKVTGVSWVDDKTGDSRKITVDVQKQTAAVPEGAGLAPTGTPGTPGAPSTLGAPEAHPEVAPLAAGSVSRITKEALAGLSEVYPKEFLQKMGLDL